MPSRKPTSLRSGLYEEKCGGECSVQHISPSEFVAVATVTRGSTGFPVGTEEKLECEEASTDLL